MNKDDNTYKTLKLILQTGQIRASSLRLYLAATYNNYTSGWRKLRKLQSEGFIDLKRYSIKKSSNNRIGFDDVFYLTTKGKNLILENEEDAYYMDSYMSFEKRFLQRKESEIPRETERIERLLGDNDILSLFSACNIPVFTHDKPSLSCLKNTLEGNAFSFKKDYMDFGSKNDLKKLLSSGIYYSIKELLEFADECSTGLSDTITGTRARGVFISSTSIFPIYLSRRYDNKLLRVNQKGERGLLEFLETFSSFTNAYAFLPELNEYVYDEFGNKKLKSIFKSKAYALVISDGDMLSYAIATGHAKGKIKDHNIYKESFYSGAKTSTLLTADTFFYDKIYCVPMSLNGYYSLYYLLTHSLLDMRNDGIEILENSLNFIKENDSSEVYPYYEIESKNPVIYMPVIEAKELSKISKSKNTPVFVTFKDHMDVIARSVRRECKFYDIAKACFADKNDVLIYDFSGSPKGVNVLDSYLNSIGKTFDRNTEGYRLPAKFQMDYIVFYNALARGELLPEDVAHLVNTKEYIEKKREYKKRVTMSFIVNKEFSLEIKEAAKKEEISVSKFISKALRVYIKEKQ